MPYYFDEDSSGWEEHQAQAQNLQSVERKALRQDTLKAREELLATGLRATAEEFEKWLSSWGTENELPAPVCHK